MWEHRYDINISESCVDSNPLMVERQDPDDFTRFQTRERCTMEIAAYVFKTGFTVFSFISTHCILYRLFTLFELPTQVLTHIR